MNILGIIPARGGSKGIPCKNIIPLAGKPLVAYTCEAARGSTKLTRVILNTDSPEIAEVGREYGVDVPFFRPQHLAEDDTPILPVIQHTIGWLENNADFYTDIVVLLQPTSPLRTALHIDTAVELMLDSLADTVVSVIVVPHNFNPVSVMRQDDRGYLTPFLKGELILRRQDKPRVFARNGPAVLIIRRSVIEQGKLYGDKVLPLEMGWVESIDIDNLEDLEQAAFWLKYLEEKVAKKNLSMKKSTGL
ncbi:MAG: acylneuraminate cytidylyltransferase family protein [Anaerolineales bacterium]|nr:acylneuraminate cytidylyltransferase family protein [Anaerolineales bacterium]